MEITYHYQSGPSYHSSRHDEDFYDESEFEMDVDEREWVESLPDNEIAEMAEEAYEKMSEQEQSDILTELLNDGDLKALKKIDTQGNQLNKKYVPDWDYIVTKDKDWVIDVAVYDNIDDYYEQIKDYFADEASYQCGETCY